MLVSTKGRYALRVMIDLAQHNTGGYIPLKEIAFRQEISEKYLESIISILVKADFVCGLRGKGGGYKLNKGPKEYTVKSILELTGCIAPVSCLENSPNKCQRAYACLALPMWSELNEIINDYLESVTLWDLIKDNTLAPEYII